MVVVALCLIARVLACEGRVRGAGWEVGSSKLAPLDFSGGPSISRLRQDRARIQILLTRAGLGQPCVCTQNIPKGTAVGDPARALTRGQVGADKAHTGVVQPHSDGHRACREGGSHLTFVSMGRQGRFRLHSAKAESGRRQAPVLHRSDGTRRLHRPPPPVRPLRPLPMVGPLPPCAHPCSPGSPSCLSPPTGSGCHAREAAGRLAPRWRGRCPPAAARQPGVGQGGVAPALSCGARAGDAAAASPIPSRLLWPVSLH